MKKILFILTLLVSLLITSLTACSDKDNPKEFYEDDMSKTQKIVKVTVGVNKMREILGDKNIYPDYYRYIKLAMIGGKSEEQAIRSAENIIIEESAMYSEAKKQGLKFSKKDFEKYNRKIVDEVKKSDDYSEIDQFYSKENTSYEKEYEKSKYWNIRHYMIKSLDNMLSDDKTYEDIVKRNKKTVYKYKKSDDYTKLHTVLAKCKSVFKEYGNDASEIKDDSRNKSFYIY